MTEISGLIKGLALFEQPQAGDWQKAEASLGLALPLDFKALVSQVGTGWFGNLILFNPASRLPNVELVGNIQACAEKVSLLRRDLDLPIFPESRGYVHLGHGTDRWDLLWRRTTGQPADLVWVDWDAGEYFPLSLPLPDFLVGAFRGRLVDARMRQLGGSVWFTGDREFFLPLQPRT